MVAKLAWKYWDSGLIPISRQILTPRLTIHLSIQEQYQQKNPDIIINEKLKKYALINLSLQCSQFDFESNTQD